jgi:pentapeptide MXKDX repeat protein
MDGDSPVAEVPSCRTSPGAASDKQRCGPALTAGGSDWPTPTLCLVDHVIVRSGPCNPRTVCSEVSLCRRFRRLLRSAPSSEEEGAFMTILSRIVPIAAIVAVTAALIFASGGSAQEKMKDGMGKEDMMKKDEMSKGDMKKDGMKKDAMGGDSMKKDDMMMKKKDEMKK